MRYLLHDVFLKSVRKFPKNIAIYEENGNEITYTQLNTLSNQFANYLSQYKGEIRNNPFVGIISPVHINSIASILGVLKIGGAYIPLDEYSPVDRLEKIIENTKLDVVLVDSHYFEKYTSLFDNSLIKKVILLDNNIPDWHNEKIVSFETVKSFSDTEPNTLNQVCDDLAYILHSSGSTGVPKGIMLTHRNARTFVDWMQKEFALTESDVVMSRAPFKFDLSVFDIFNTLNVGAKLVCYDWNNKREEDERHKSYVRLMSAQKATILYTTPSTFISLMNRGELGKSDICLREIMYAGEPFPTPLIRRLQSILPNTKIANIYGPTETNIITYYWIDEIPENNTPIPLGREVEDTEILIVKEEGDRICDANELGEIWCRGGTVTLGYLGMEEKTRLCLVDSPFHKYPAKFWRTGDYGFRDEKGILHYRGRKDHMVKVKGFRIELGEVESALSNIDELDEFVVVAIPDEKYGNRLYCYYVNKKGHSLSEEDIKSFLLTKIPEYMTPYKFIEKEILPKTSSGKIDRVLLAETTI